MDGAGVGIGTGFPAADLDIRNVTGSANTAFRLTNGGNTWSATNAASGNFFFSRIGSGGQELTVRERNHAVATLDVQGHVRGTSFVSTSSRTLKTAFEVVEPLDVLDKLAALPVSAWRYRTESEGKRHVGPVAEDFQRLFGLGDGKTIATVDADGVMMAAIQGLYRQMQDVVGGLEAQNAAKGAEIAALKTANAELAERVEALERRP